VLLDLDGVLYRGDQPIPRAAAAVDQLRRRGIVPVFVTNNSSRTPDQVAEKLSALGVGARAEEVVTSAAATASYLSAAGLRTAFVVGEDGILSALRGAGIEVLPGEAGRADAVVVGWDGGATYDKLRTASTLVQRGARLVATNADASFPAPGGVLWPGAGALLAVITTTTGATAEVVGKPAPTLFEAARRVGGGGAALVVGDRLDTDVAAATAAGMDSLLVLTGVTRPGDLLAAEILPNYIAGELGGLARPGALVRAAGSADLPAIRSLLASAGLAYPDDDVPAENLVATSAREVVGTVTLESLDGCGHLRSLAVDRHHRGARVGVSLVAHLVRRARSLGLRELYAVSETAAGFFASLGFEAVGDRRSLPAPIASRPSVVGGCGPDAAAFRLPL
jgi:HAD superfamily hydrolase (TIGR01457 family)